jgi:hypothetical protein
MAQFQPHHSKKMVTSSSLFSSAEEKGSATNNYRGFQAQVTRQLQEDATNCWKQVGKDIDGEEANDASGSSVALSADGSRVIIGAPLNAGNGRFSGHARVLEYDGSNWNKLGSDIDGEAAFDESGFSVDITADGSRVIIGALLDDDNGSNSGRARVLEYDGTDWNKLGNDIDGEAADDRSGYSVAISANGSRVIIGAPVNADNGRFSGHARVLEYDGSNWNKLGSDIDGEAAFDASGQAVAISADGNRVIIGADGNGGDNGRLSGHARVLEYDGTDWNKLGNDIDGEAAFDASGWSVAITADGNRVIIGARGTAGYGSNPGHARVLEYDGIDWNKLGNDIDGEQVGDRFGHSVAITANGSRVIIGAIGVRFGISGVARVFDWVDQAWMPTGLAINGEAAGDQSGYSVAIAADGNLIASGARDNDGSNGSFSGHVRLYEAEVRCLQCSSFLRL